MAHFQKRTINYDTWNSTIGPCQKIRWITKRIYEIAKKEWSFGNLEYLALGTGKYVIRTNSKIPKPDK